MTFSDSQSAVAQVFNIEHKKDAPTKGAPL